MNHSETIKSAASDSAISTQSQCEPTPGPWITRLDGNHKTFIRAASNRAIASTFVLTDQRSIAENEANAAFICRARNSHAELVALARSVMEADSEGHMMPKWLAEEARAALSKATGGAE